MSIDETIDRMTQRINGNGAVWLHVEPMTTEPPAVAMTVSILRPLGALADDDSPQAIGDALAELFDGLADHIRATTRDADDIDNSTNKTLASAAST